MNVPVALQGVTMNKSIFKGHYVVTISIIVNLLLFGAKYLIGVQNQSLAIRADAWHTLSDSISSIIVMAGLLLSKRPKNSRHPFGFGRFEVITSIIVAVMLGQIGIRFIKEAVQSFTSPQLEIQYSNSSIIIMVVTILCKEVMAQLSIRVGKKQDSPSLIADGWHHRSDAISSIVIIIGIWLNRFIPRIDGILSLVVAAMILYAAYEIMKDSIKTIIGEPIPSSLKKQIIGQAKIVTPEIQELHSFKYHSYGRHVEVSFHGYFHDEIKLKDAHDCVTRLENALHEESDLHCLIHPEVRP